MKLPSLVPCQPPRWARGGHAQTLWGHLLPSPQFPKPGEKFEIVLPDGDRLVGSYFSGDSDSIVYLFHGLGGDTNSDYIRRSVRIAQAQGHGVYIANHRGCGDGVGLAKRPYHSGSADDLSRVLAFGRKHHPEKRHIAVGFSLSGNALLLLLAGEHGGVLPDAAIAVNAPINLERAALKLKEGLNRIYDNRFLALAVDSIRSRERAGLIAKQYRIPRLTTLHDFDNLYTAPAGGFMNREDYYARCSAKDRLQSITVPTILLTANDDPFVSVEDYLEAKLGARTRLHVEKVGGHMGYVSANSTPLGTRRWQDYAVHTFLATLTQ